MYLNIINIYKKFYHKNPISPFRHGLIIKLSLGIFLIIDGPLKIYKNSYNKIDKLAKEFYYKFK